MDEIKYLYQYKCESIFNITHECKKEIYDEVYKSYRLYLKFLWIEEKFNILLENYYEFEEEIYMVYNKIINESEDKAIIKLGQEGIIKLNRRLANFLGSTRMYIDQVKHDLSEIDKIYNSSLSKDFTDETNIQYDKNFGYKISEFLRNVTQHIGLFIYGIEIAKLAFDNIDTIDSIPISIELDYKSLENTKGFSNKISKNNPEYKIKNNLVTILRNYIEGIVNVHNKYKTLIYNYAQKEYDTIYKYASINDIAFIKCNKEDKVIDFVLLQSIYLERLTNITKNIELDRTKFFMNKKSFDDTNIPLTNCKNLKIKYNQR